MAKRIFISFAVDDKFYRDGLVQQAKDARSPFELVDMSVKEPWSDSWKTRCRTRIKGCDGLIAMLSKNTTRAQGARWEISCAKEEALPVLGIKIHKDEQLTPPPELGSSPVRLWTWDNVSKFLDSL